MKITVRIDELALPAGATPAELRALERALAERITDETTRATGQRARSPARLSQAGRAAAAEIFARVRT